MLFSQCLRYLLYGLDINDGLGVVQVNKGNVLLSGKDLSELYVRNISQLDNIVTEKFAGDIIIFLGVKYILKLLFGNDALINHVLTDRNVLHKRYNSFSADDICSAASYCGKNAGFLLFAVKNRFFA